MSVSEQAKQARQAAYRLATAPSDLKNRALAAVARALRENAEAILRENRKDLEEARASGLKESLAGRLALSAGKIDQLAAGVQEVARLEDPVGRSLLARELDRDLRLYQVSVPIGVIGVIFESRPDALVQIASLCLKSGNAAILKGGSEARRSNRILFDLVSRAAEQTDPRFRGGLQLVETREDVRELLALDTEIDLMIPRGSGELVRYIQQNTKIPVLGHSAGVCHLYVDRQADLPMALDLAWDAKCQYPAVCNAIETLLVHAGIAAAFLPRLAERLAGVELRGDERTRGIIPAAPAGEEDWWTEYNDLVLSIKVVDSLQEAVDHINTYGSHHTDAIVTSDAAAAETFLQQVDSASVMWNASTRFADGFRYGMGAEVGISTSRIHARGPVGLEGLTIYKFKVIGGGHTVAAYAEGKKRFTHRDLT
jgi:glutamate-5-semialdehyde dehydrogenase